MDGSLSVSNVLPLIHAELRALAGEDATQAFIKAGTDVVAQKATFKVVFTNIMQQSAAAVKAQLDSLLPRLVQSAGKQDWKPTYARDLDPFALALRLSQQYPGDVGIFCPFLLNAFQLQPGESSFLGPNEPHAYLAGDCVECMACSDNVVRAGLTPKHRDVATLCSMLTYRMGYPVISAGTPVDSCSVIYTAPVEEFELVRSTVPPATAAYSLPVADGSAGIVLCYQGEGVAVVGDQRLPFHKGSILLVPQGSHVSIASDAGSLLFRCASPGRKAAAHL